MRLLSPRRAGGAAELCLPKIRWLAGGGGECRGCVQLVAVGVQIQPYRCYRYGLYTCLHPLADPPLARVRLRVAMRTASRPAEGRASRGAVGRRGGRGPRAGTEGRDPGPGRGRSAAGRGHPAAGSPRAAPPAPAPAAPRCYGFTLSHRCREGRDPPGTPRSVWLGADGNPLGGSAPTATCLYWDG